MVLQNHGFYILYKTNTKSKSLKQNQFLWGFIIYLKRQLLILLTDLRGERGLVPDKEVTASRVDAKAGTHFPLFFLMFYIVL